MRISEIYRSVQGEGPDQGRPCVLVRLAGCNLRCRYCDTAEARDAGAGAERSLGSVVGEVEAAGPRSVLVTGGEPLLSPEAPALLEDLLGRGFAVALETNGSLPLDAVPPGVSVCLDIKCPGSGCAGASRMDQARRLRPTDQIKFVLADEADYRFAREACRELGLGRPGRRTEGPEILLGPVHGELDPVRIVEWMLADGLEARLNLQLHKILWGPQARRV